ncbi:MAG: polysaccharide deacetylase family protein, partial [Roseimicrobium sp.]
IDAMPNTLDGLLAKGFRFVTVSQLLNMESFSAPPALRPMEPAAVGAPLPPGPGMGPMTAPKLMPAAFSPLEGPILPPR